MEHNKKMTTSSESIPPSIIMDERERGIIRQEIQKLPLNIEIATLEYGDYLISPEIVIERKRGDDFVASIYDNRLFTQILKLKAFYTSPIILIENPKLMFSRPFVKESSVYGALAYISSRLDITVIPTSDESTTANFICNLASSTQKQDPTQIPTIPDKMPKDFISRIDQIGFLEGFINTGAKKAKRLMDIFQTPERVLQAIQLTQVEYTAKGNPKKIHGLLENVKDIGPKFLATNKRMLHTNFRQAKKQKDPTKM